MSVKLIFTNWWEAISCQGTTNCSTEKDIKFVRTLNQSAVVNAITLLLCIPIVFQLGFSFRESVVLGMFAIGYLSVITVNRFLHYRWGLWTIFLCASFFIFWTSSTFGYNSHTHYGFILVSIGITLNLYRQFPRLFWSLMVLNGLLIGLLYFSDFSLLSATYISSESILKLSFIEFFLLLGIVTIMAIIYVNNQQKLVSKLEVTQSDLEKKNQALTKINQELDQFVYSVSHDLRAPIASTLGLIELSQQESDMSTVQEYLKLKEKSLHKLDTFISELIDYSRNTRLDIQHDQIDFRSVIEEILEEHSYSERAMQISMASDTRQSSTFISDQRRLRMILHNLVSNGIRYSNLEQEQPYLKVIVNVTDKEVIIKVTDNGVGIHPRHQTNIFDMFFRARETEVGSGLGLYIAKEATEKLRGQITVDSSLGEGTTFTVVLPNLLKPEYLQETHTSGDSTEQNQDV